MMHTPFVSAAATPPPVNRIHRYGKATAKPGQGDELARLLLRAAESQRSDDGCELYLVSRQADERDTVWVTELWRDQAALDASIERIRGSAEVAGTMALVDKFEMVELDLLGGKG